MKANNNELLKKITSLEEEVKLLNHKISDLELQLLEIRSEKRIEKQYPWYPGEYTWVARDIYPDITVTTGGCWRPKYSGCWNGVTPVPMNFISKENSVRYPTTSKITSKDK